MNHTERPQLLGRGESGIPKLKSELHTRNTILSVCWSCKTIIRWEVHPTSSPVTAEIYCKQFDRVAAVLRGKLDKVFFLQYNGNTLRRVSRKVSTLGMACTDPPTVFSRLAANRQSSISSATQQLAR